MKPVWFYLLAILISSCHSRNKILIEPGRVDSLIRNWSVSKQELADEEETIFWQSRIDGNRPGLVNEQKYANSLLARFYQKGEIADLNAADSLMKSVDNWYRRSDPAISLSLVHFAMLRHHFHEAKDFLNHARELNARKYPLLLAAFDISFELGEYDSAEKFLYDIRGNKDFNYLFRLSKWQHLNGAIDSAFQSMLEASKLSGQNSFLKQVALSNAADLCVHMGNLAMAADLYYQCIHLNPSDFHSMTGLGWIAWVHDGDDSLAEKIFQFVHGHSKAPDPLLKLAQLENSRGNIEAARSYGHAFISQAGDKAFGNMYNKYLIDLYTGICKDPSKAEAIASKEISNRATPQTYAWLAWALANHNKSAEASELYEKHVSGKALEGQELLWTGNMMQSLKRNYDAIPFLEAAEQNIYDFPSDIAAKLQMEIHK